MAHLMIIHADNYSPRANGEGWHSEVLSDRMKGYLDGLVAVHDGEEAYRGTYQHAGGAAHSGAGVRPRGAGRPWKRHTPGGVKTTSSWMFPIRP